MLLWNEQMYNRNIFCGAIRLLHPQYVSTYFITLAVMTFSFMAPDLFQSLLQTSEPTRENMKSFKGGVWGLYRGLALDLPPCKLQAVKNPHKWQILYFLHVLSCKTKRNLCSAFIMWVSSFSWKILNLNFVPDTAKNFKFLGGRFSKHLYWQINCWRRIKTYFGNAVGTCTMRMQGEEFSTAPLYKPYRALTHFWPPLTRLWHTLAMQFVLNRRKIG